MNKLPFILWAIAAGIFAVQIFVPIPLQYLQAVQTIGTGCLIGAVGIDLGFWKTLKEGVVKK